VISRDSLFVFSPLPESGVLFNGLKKGRPVQILHRPVHFSGLPVEVLRRPVHFRAALWGFFVVLLPGGGVLCNRMGTKPDRMT
jgi:hypothetical protein